ncbi:hypothetical protein RI129_010867 [Pyrocoelia pectoralis]|uniref:Piwi domain-containing protein n=1 Tax=Pyrocoelia pectoralis TaxID=417401 RepID=A0AAN7ZGU7_9COLE
MHNSPNTFATINAFTVNSNNVFEYTASFSANLDLPAKVTFLKRYFSSVGCPYIQNNNVVYTLETLSGKNLSITLHNRKLQSDVLMTMRFVRRRKLDVALVGKFMENICDLISIPEVRNNVAQTTIVPKFVYSVHNGHNILICIDSCYYEVQPENINDVICRYKKLRKGYCESALNFFLNKSYIYCDIDGKIYRHESIDWETDSVVLRPFRVSVTFDHLHFAKLVPSFNESSTLLRDNLKKLITNKIFGLNVTECTKVSACLLPQEIVTFADGVSYTCTSWNEQMRNNEVLSPVELWCWVMIYEAKDEHFARKCVKIMQEIQENTGIRIGGPLYLPIKGDTKADYVNVLSAIETKEVQLIVVLVNESLNKPKNLIKRMCFVKYPIPCHIIRAKNVQYDEIYDETLRINAKLGASLWSVSLPRFKMICGIDTYVGFDRKTPPACSLVANLGDDTVQWYSKVAFCEGDSFRRYIKEWFVDIVQKYKELNGYPPTEVIVYHTNNGLPTQEIDTIYKELRLDPIALTIILVSGTKIKIFENKEIVLPGSIFNNVINTNFLNFALMSSATCGSVPATLHYTILKHNGNTSLDVLQQLTYKLCYIYYKKMEVSEMPAPCIYARKLSKLVTEKIFAIPSCNLDMYLYYM